LFEGKLVKMLSNSSSYSVDEDFCISTNKINKILKVLEETDIKELLAIFENTNSNSSDDDKISKTTNIEINTKLEVGRNLFSYELFILNYYKDLNQYKCDLERITINYGKFKDNNLLDNNFKNSPM